MEVTFWGTRGSVPCPSRDTIKYGGNTSCVEVRTKSGQLIVIDCGTGGHALGRKLSNNGGQASGALLISHTHWDHIQGVPFFQPLFDAENRWDVYAPRGLGQSLKDTLSGQMQYAYFPITLEAMGAEIRFHELVEGVFELGEARITAQYLNHPALTLGYRVEADGAAIVYACDHESFSRMAIPDEAALSEHEARHIDFLKDADLVIHDAQYTADEYADKTGWGHSTVEYAIAVARAAGAKRLAITHHDPMRTDADLDAIVARHQPDDGPTLLAAAEGTTLQLLGVAKPTSAPPKQPSALEGEVVSLAGLRAEVARTVQAAVEAENLSIAEPGSAPPTVVVLDAADPNLVATAAKIAAEVNGGRAPSYLLITDPATAAPADLEADEIAWPFTAEYAQARIRAAVMRTQCRWIRAELPEKEGQRIAELHRLEILDTDPEDRFDRLTRMAAQAFGTPISLVSLMDNDRQWFKSCFGVAMDETPRELAFCAHTILEDDLLIVPDLLADHRFADHPFVTGGPRVRFYAGAPIRTNGRDAVGTFCLIDQRPRDLTTSQRALLEDFAALAAKEITA